jgi:predicted RNA polymerase sigma factor
VSPAAATQRAIEAVWRIESARLIGGLARMVRDVSLAEDLAQDALVAALVKWPESGVPDNPGAWLMATAKHRAIDLMRRNRRLETKQQELAWELGVRIAMSTVETPDEIGDDILALMFTCCHPAGLGSHSGAADRARQARAGGRAGALRGAGRRRAGAAAGVRARGRLPDLQRGLRRERR